MIKIISQNYMKICSKCIKVTHVYSRIQYNTIVHMKLKKHHIHKHEYRYGSCGNVCMALWSHTLSPLSVREYGVPE